MDVGWGFSSPLIFRSAFASAAAISPIHLHQQFLSFLFFSFLFFSFLFFSFPFLSFLFFSFLYCIRMAAIGVRACHSCW